MEKIEETLKTIIKNSKDHADKCDCLGCILRRTMQLIEDEAVKVIPASVTYCDCKDDWTDGTAYCQECHRLRVI